jgi:hypothetical protein
MPQAFAVPPPATYQGERPTQAALQRRREQLRESGRSSLERADALVRSQQLISQDLGQELGALQSHGAHLQELEQRDRERGLLAQLVRGLNRRQHLLERRSAAEGLLERYEAVTRQLGRAAAFTDELQLCALELQSAVESLHQELILSERNRRRGAERILAIERTLGEIDAAEGPVAGRESLLDKLHFEQRHETLQVELFEAQVRLLRAELDPARALRDTMLDLYQEMAGFVQAARSSADTAGRRIQALGLAADAPMVVAELQASLDELGTAMQATEAYLGQTQRLLVEVLPALSARLEARVGIDGVELATDLDEVSRERARASADRALREAAQAEVDGWLDEDA